MNIKVGGREVIHSSTFVVATGEEAVFDFDVDGIAFLGVLKFVQDPGVYFNVRWNTSSNKVDIIATSWNAHQGVGAMPNIGHIITINGNRIGFFFTHMTVSNNLHSVTLQIYKGGNQNLQKD